MGKRKITVEDVAAAAEQVRQAQDRLEAQVVALRETGASLSTIAEAIGYSPAGVLKMLRRHGVR